MSKHFEVITPWTGTGTEEDSNRPAVADDHAISKWTDSTAQPAENLTPDPNMYIIEAWCSDAVFADIEADANYQILWSEDV